MAKFLVLGFVMVFGFTVGLVVYSEKGVQPQKSCCTKQRPSCTPVRKAALLRPCGENCNYGLGEFCDCDRLGLMRQ